MFIAIDERVSGVVYISVDRIISFKSKSIDNEECTIVYIAEKAIPYIIKEPTKDFLARLEYLLDK